MKNSWLSLLKLDKFNFGERLVYQFVIFECKFLFSIYVFYFPKSAFKQDRYHTHAFDSISIKLFGSYQEYVLINDSTGEYKKEERNKIFKWFPRDKYYSLDLNENTKKDYFHCIGESTKGCMTILFAGPWSNIWREWINGKVKLYRWGRKGETEVVIKSM